MYKYFDFSHTSIHCRIKDTSTASTVFKSTNTSDRHLNCNIRKSKREEVWKNTGTLAPIPKNYLAPYEKKWPGSASV